MAGANLFDLANGLVETIQGDAKALFAPVPDTSNQSLYGQGATVPSTVTLAQPIQTVDVDLSTLSPTVPLIISAPGQSLYVDDYSSGYAYAAFDNDGADTGGSIVLKAGTRVRRPFSRIALHGPAQSFGYNENSLSAITLSTYGENPTEIGSLRGGSTSGSIGKRLRLRVCANDAEITTRDDAISVAQRAYWYGSIVTSGTPISGAQITLGAFTVGDAAFIRKLRIMLDPTYLQYGAAQDWDGYVLVQGTSSTNSALTWNMLARPLPSPYRAIIGAGGSTVVALGAPTWELDKTPLPPGIDTLNIDFYFYGVPPAGRLQVDAWMEV